MALFRGLESHMTEEKEEEEEEGWEAKLFEDAISVQC
jgi:hypothetical protein